MTIQPLTEQLAAERRTALLKSADAHRQARALRRAQRPQRATRWRLRIRPIRPDDAPLLLDIFERLGPASRLARFQSPKARLTPAELGYLTHVDHRDHEALVAVTRWSGEAVGVARFIRHRHDPTSADVAIAVADDWQNRGVGSMLAEQLTASALREGISQFTALVGTGNVRARRLLTKVGSLSHITSDGVTISYRVRLANSAPAPKVQDHTSGPSTESSHPTRQDARRWCT